MAWRKVISFIKTEGSGVKYNVIPRPCMQCEDAPCVKVCPTQASHYDSNGLVQVNYDRCIGCKYCMQACPYGVRRFNKSGPQEKLSHNPDVKKRQHGVVEKCTYCRHRLAKDDYTKSDHGKMGRMTACSQICAAGANWFGDLDDPNSMVSKLVKSGRAIQLRAELHTKPRTFYLKD
jgi:molybdopterin-containing oxidoreductase family iron-sulfur binding subunit